MSKIFFILNFNTHKLIHKKSLQLVKYILKWYSTNNNLNSIPI